MTIPLSRRMFIVGESGNAAEVDSNGNLHITLGTGGDINVDNTSLSTTGYIGKPSGGNGDFVTAYNAATKITCSSLPSGVSAINKEDIVAIQQINAAGAVVNTYTRDDATMTVAANVITVTGATFGATDTFVVYTSINRSVSADTELPAAAALADNAANPTSPAVGAFGMAFDGSTWDRLRGDSANGLLVNLGSNNDVVVGGAAADGAAVSGNPVRVGGKDGSGNTQDIVTDTDGHLQVDVLTVPSTTVTATNLDIRDLTNASDSITIYGSDDGGTTKRIIKTDSGGAIQVDLEVASVTANAGTNLNTSALALESGGNLATIAGDTTSLDTKLPASGALADNTANPTLTQISSFLMNFDGSTWDRVKGDSTNGLLVNLGSNNDVVVGGAAADGAAVSGNPVRIGGKDGSGNTQDIVTDTDGHLQVDVLSVPSTTVTATNLDIRDLVNASDSVAVYGSDDSGTTKRILKTDSGGALQVDVESGSITADTELPAAAALSDAVGNPTTPMVGAALMGWDGSNWERIKTDTDNRLLIAGGGTAGSADDAVVTIQGVASMTPVAATISSGTITTLTTLTGGGVAHDASDSGNPIKVGGKAYNFDGTAPGTAVAENDRANFITDVYGRQFVETTHPRLWTATANYGSAQTNTEIKATPGAGLSLFITDIIISTDTAGSVKLVEATGAAVDKVELMYFAANGGIAMPFKTPIKLTANVNLGVTSTIAGNHSVTVNGYIGP